MLASPPGMSKQLSITEVGGPDAARITTAAAASYQDYDPKFDSPFSMDSFSGGVGQLPFDNGDENALWWAPGVVLHVDGKAFLAPSVNNEALTSATSQINGFRTYTTSAGARTDYCWVGTRIYKRDAANRTNDWVVAYTHASQNVSDFLVFNGVGVIAVPADSGTTDYLTVTGNLTGASGFTTSNMNHTPFSSGTKPKFFCAIRGTLYALVDNAKVYYTVDPTTDGWVGPISVEVGAGSAPNVGENSYPFTNVAAAGDYLFAFKADAGYNIDAEQNVTEVFYQWRDKPSILNFEHVAVSPNALLFAVGNEVYAYDPQTGLSPALGLARQSGFSTKEILGVAADNQYTYVLAKVRVPTINSADSVALFRCFRKSGNRWGFEVLWEDTTVSSDIYYGLGAFPFGFGTRLYWGVTTSSVTSTNIMDIPADWDETTNSAFVSSGILYTSITRAMFPGFIKRHLWINYETEGTTSSSLKVSLAYSVNNGATWVALGDTGSGAAGLLTTRHLYTAIASQSIALRFTLAGTGTATPILRVFDHHQRVRFRYLPNVTATVRVADNLEVLSGATERTTKDQIRDNIETLRTSDSQILYEDYLGNSFNCTVDMIGFTPTRHQVPNGLNVYEQDCMILISRADAGD